MEIDLDLIANTSYETKENDKTIEKVKEKPKYEEKPIEQVIEDENDWIKQIKERMDGKEVEEEKPKKRQPKKKQPKKEEPFVEEMDEEKLMELRIILKLYMMQFKEELKEFQKKDLDKMNSEQLKTLRRYFDFILGASKATSNKVKMFFGVILALEKTLTSYDLLDVTGLTRVLYSDNDFHHDLKRLSLKYLSSYETRPEISVPLTILQTCIQLDKVNSESKQNILVKQEKDKNKESIEDVNNRYKDL